MTDIAYIYEIY